MQLRSNALLLALVATTSVLLVAHFAQVQADDDESASPQQSGFKALKLLNFSSFKKLFNKSYRSPGEASNRQKIFLSHVFQSFLSMIRYSHKKSTHYLSVNEMSDWSPKEFKQTLMEADTYYREVSRHRARSQTLASVLEDKETDSMIEQTLSEVDTNNNKIAELNMSAKPSWNGFSQMSNTFSDIKQQIKKIPFGKLNPVGLFDLFSQLYEAGHARIANEIDNRLIRRFYKPPKRRQDLPDEVFFDHSKTGCLGPPKNQRECGSCYIFGTLAFYEWAYCREFGQQVRFSEQYVLDCGRRIGMQGCLFGFEAHVSIFSNKYGFELMKDISYVGRESICPYDKLKYDKMGKKIDKQLEMDLEVPSEVGEDAMGMYRTDDADLVELPGPQAIERQLAISPVVFVFKTSKDLQDYGGGVDLGEGCKYSQELHTMLIVGSGRQDGYEYWLARNSYGPSWGEEGHWKIAKDSPCYTTGNLGLTTVALNYNKAPMALANSTIPLIDLANLTDQQVLVYNFTENPKHNRKYVQKAVAKIQYKLED